MTEKQTLKEFLRNWNFVYWKVSAVVGAPILMCFLLVFAQKVVFTATCNLAGFQCRYSFGSADSIANSVAKTMGSDAHAEDRGELVAKLELPESENDKERFDKVVAAAKKAGAKS